MKKNDTRELLLITKAAEHWHEHFDQKVDELMDLMNKVDTIDGVMQCVEVLDVYHSALPEGPGKHRSRKRRTITTQQKPFEFIAFRN